MQIVLRKWGNSLGLRIPTVEIERLGWKAGKLLDVADLPKGLKLETVDDTLAWMDSYPSLMRGNSFWGNAPANIEGEVW